MANPVKNSTLILIYRLLFSLLLCLILGFLAGTVYVLFFRPDNSAVLQMTADKHGEPDQERIFTGIGRLRLPTADPDQYGTPGTVAVLSVTFPYSPEDRAFSEELAARTVDFRSITAEYFAVHTAADLVKRGEEAIKKDLLDRFNRILRLGKIRLLYFNDFLILE